MSVIENKEILSSPATAPETICCGRLDKQGSVDTSGKKKLFEPKDYIGLTALIISLITAIYSFVGWMKGPIVSFIPPAQIALRCYPAERKGNELECGPSSYVFLVGTNMTYVNKGRSDYSAILYEETAQIKVAGHDNKLLYWQEFDTLTTQGTGSNQLASAMVIPGSSSVAHSTRFFPRDEPCKSPCVIDRNFLKWHDFVDVAAKPNLKIEIEFTAKIDDKQLKGRCSVRMRQNDQNEFALKGMQKTNVTSLICER